MAACYGLHLVFNCGECTFVHERNVFVRKHQITDVKYFVRTFHVLTAIPLFAPHGTRSRSGD